MNIKVQEMVDKARNEIECLSIEDALLLHKEDDPVFVDVRDPRELWREGKIANAIHAPRGMLEFWIDPNSPYHKEIFAEPRKFVFYCAIGWRSALAAQTAQQMGLNVSHIEGGFNAWKEKQGTVESVAQPTPANNEATNNETTND